MRKVPVGLSEGFRHTAAGRGYRLIVTDEPQAAGKILAEAVG